MMHFVRESQIKAPPWRVFRFHESPGALERLIPPWEAVEVIESDRSLAPGSRVVLRQRLGPFSLLWVAVHEAYEPPRYFSDRQESGPFASWQHEHFFLDDGQGGTLLRDEIRFRPPGGRLGRWLAGPGIVRRLDKMFDYRHAITRSAVENEQNAAKNL